MTSHTRVQPIGYDATTDPQKVSELLGNVTKTVSLSADVATGKPIETLDVDRLSGGEAPPPQRPSMRRSVTSGRSSFSEPMKLIGQQTLELVREKKAKQKWRRATYMAIVMAVIGFMIMFGVVVVANEFSKELKTSNEAHEMRAPTGELLTVGQAKSYATLFDLPAFDTETLAHLQQLTIVVTPREGGQANHATLHIVSAMKGLHATACTLFGSAGSKVVIDTQSRTAFAVIDGANYVVHDLETTQQRERRLGAKAVPRLHAEDEFFTAVHGFHVERDAETGAVVRRRLQSESEMQGYAEFAVAASRGVLDYFSAQDGVDYQTVYMSGTMYADGDTVGAGVSLFYSKTAETSLAMVVSTAETSMLFSNRVDNSSALTPFVYTYSAGGALHECIPTRRIEDSPWDTENSTTIDAAALSLAVHAVGDSLTVVLPGEDDEDDWVFVVDNYVLDAAASDYAALQAPSDDDCLALLAPPTEDDAPPTIEPDDSGAPTDPAAAVEMLLQSVVNDSSIDRRLSSARRLEDVMNDGAKLLNKDVHMTDDELAEMEHDMPHARRLSASTSRGYPSDSRTMFIGGAYTAYSGKVGDTCKKHKYPKDCKKLKWDTFAVCEKGSAKATFTSKKFKGGDGKEYLFLSLNFAGTDDGGDIISDLTYFKKTSPKTGKVYHTGFYEYQHSLSGCINAVRAELNAKGLELDYITGHSLGGAGASIYAQEHGNALKGVVTWGAPKTNIGGGKITGWRFFHEDDLVSGSFAAFNGILYAFCPFCAALFSVMNAVQGGCPGAYPLSCYDHKLTKAYEYYDKLVCDHKKAKRAANKQVKYRCKWWQLGCHVSYGVRYAAVYAANLCQWRKKRKSVGSSKAYAGWYILNAGVHTKYGDWEGKGDYSVIKF